MATRTKTNAMDSSMFQDDPFHDVGYIFTNINRFFNALKDFLPFNQLNGVLFFDKEIGDDGS